MVAAALVGGFVLLALILQDAFEVMLLPRRLMRRWRLTRGYFRFAWGVWRSLGSMAREGARRERFLSIFGPMSMMMLFALWAGGLILAFALIQWAIQRSLGFTATLGDQIYLSGVTFFTLGYGDEIPRGAWGRILAVIEAGVGFGLIAVVIGYLPVLYQLFSRREAHVIQLDARAGSPPSASVMLRRHAESAGLDKIDEVLRAWEIWGSELLESHLSYPMLAFYRSQHDDQSWLAAMAAVMDTCALILVGVEDIGPLQARMTFAMCRQVLVELVRSLDLPATRSQPSERLTGPEFDAMIEELQGVGLRWSGDPGAEEILTTARATYEPQLDSLADYLLISVPRWVGFAETPDHWDRGPRGIIARRLVEGLSSGASDKASAVTKR
ncbi:MAG TPA: potassium channel family protein [Caulobacteraceae bacterium]|jgi:hypothetical protein